MNANHKTSRGRGEDEFESSLIQSFSKHVRTYDKNAQLQKTMAERLAALLPPTLPEPVLELGCGTGLFTRHLLTRGAEKLILNDIAPAMIEYLKEHLDLPEATRFVEGNAERLEFPPAGLIAANAVFQWFQHPQHTLETLHRSLPQGGQIVFSTFGPETLQEFRDSGGLEGPTHLLSLDKWKALLTRCGFQWQAAERESREIFFPGTRHLIRNLQQIGAAPLRMMKTGELRRLIETHDRNFSTPQGVYTHWELYYFSAVKK
ncbi:methyltransferase domain-containing protein [Nitrospina gracilis]|uniref:methyltransferase domain-containing protein n=1 Tax=Nitrospina gracilis TaxID=35801 RepID=UPI001F02C4D5|nr:methyltransferase domain-containing protein [Nitrospina gracilis]MCF8720631.1 malonyl-CoA O-methyltransferase [Nitrospina gracilis Nb-211]